MDNTQVQTRGHSRSKSRPRNFADLIQANRRDYIIGICLLLVVVFLWTFSNFVTQDLFEDGYGKPFLITYLNTSSFALYLFPFLIKRALTHRTEEESGGRGRARSGYEPLANDAEAVDALNPQNAENAPEHQSPISPDDLPPLTISETAKLSAWFCLIWFVANWTVNAALGYTSVASATILSSTSGFFTLAIGRLFRVEALTIVKILAVAASFGGVVLVSISDSTQVKPPTETNILRRMNPFAPAPMIGDSLALLSALFYALYVILLKVKVRNESRMNMQLFFGFVGLFNILFCWPIGILLHFTGIERLELPTTRRSIVGILINMAITLSSDYIYVLAMLKTTPLVVTVGLSLTMPLAMIGDFILHKPVKLQVILGATVVILAFVAVGLEDSKNEEEPDLLSGRPLEDGVESAVRLEEDVNLEPHQENTVRS